MDALAIVYVYFNGEGEIPDQWVLIYLSFFHGNRNGRPPVSLVARPRRTSPTLRAKLGHRHEEYIGPANSWCFHVLSMCLVWVSRLLYPGWSMWKS